MHSSLINSRHDWQFVIDSPDTCQAGKNGCVLPCGKILGGSSSINGMVYMRGSDKDYNHWSSLGNYGWDYESVLPYFKKSEANQHAPFVSKDNGRYHSATGPMKVDFVGPFSPIDYVFINAGAEMGIPFESDLNGEKKVGYIRYQATLSGGRRQSTASAFLSPARDRKNLNVIKNALVEKVLINEQKQAYGVEFTYNGTTLQAKARKEVILSAGAVMSPTILMLSGVGPQDQVENHKIPEKLNLNGVGNNLHDHIIVRLFFTFNPTTSKTSSASAFDNFYQLAIYNSGPYATPSLSAGAYINSKNDSNHCDFHFWPSYFNSKSSDFTSFLQSENYQDEIVEKLTAINQDHDVAVIFLEIMQPKSSGYIHLNGNSASKKPIIRPKYYSNNADMEAMKKEVRRQMSFANTNAYKEKGGQFVWLPLKACEQFELETDEYLECYIRQFSFSGYHPVGTCKMGVDSDTEAVVDPELRVRGIDKLRVVDNSV